MSAGRNFRNSIQHQCTCMEHVANDREHMQDRSTSIKHPGNTCWGAFQFDIEQVTLIKLTTSSILTSTMVLANSTLTHATSHHPYLIHVLSHIFLGQGISVQGQVQGTPHHPSSSPGKSTITINSRLIYSVFCSTQHYPTLQWCSSIFHCCSMALNLVAVSNNGARILFA